MVKHVFIYILSIFLISENYAQQDSIPLTAINEKSVAIIPVEGTVDAGMAAFISRALQKAKEYKNPLIILEIDTYGGEVDAAFQIVDTILNAKDTVVSYVKTKAISAGALIALSGNKLIMKKGTTLGDVAPLTYSGEGKPTMLGEKFQSPIRAKFRILAKKNGYPETLTESMVTEEMVVYEVKFSDTTLYLDSAALADLNPSQKKKILSTKTIVEKGELLTMNDAEADSLGFSLMSVDNLDDLLQRIGYADAPIIRIEENWSEKFVRFIGTIAPILMALGFAALYIELKTPGFGAPGIIGIICLATVFFSKYMVGLADYTELLLLALGIVLLAIELFVTPGFGIIGFAGIALLVVGMVLSFQDFVLPKPEFPWQFQQLTKNLITVIGSIVGSFVIIVLFFRYIFPRLGTVVNGPYLQATLEDVKVNSEMTGIPHIGEKGITISTLRPSGKILVNGEMVDVVADGEFIDKNTEVIISEISGNRIIVTRRTSL